MVVAQTALVDNWSIKLENIIESNLFIKEKKGSPIKKKVEKCSTMLSYVALLLLISLFFSFDMC